MALKVRVDDLSDGKVVLLLEAHLKEMHRFSPPESIHALDAEKLKDPSIVFWSVRAGSEIAGCGALKEITPISGKIKAMKTSPDYLRKGVGATILEEILLEAKRRQYSSVSLETGSDVAFAPAIRMYLNFGFQECGPFGAYELDPYSKFFTLKLGNNA